MYHMQKDVFFFSFKLWSGEDLDNWKKPIVMQVPVLETPDGPVFESNAIARYGEILHSASDLL